MNRTNWKIAEQSKQRMVQALLTVMKQYDYKEIANCKCKLDTRTVEI